jgi:hypothetical protein
MAVLGSPEGARLRAVEVRVGATGLRVPLSGLAADVVARVAALPLSDRTLGLLLTLIAHEDVLTGIGVGLLEIDLKERRTAVYHRRRWVQAPRRTRLGEQEENA